MVRHAEPRGDRCAVAVVAVEQLQHAARLPERASPLLRLGPRHRVDHPDAAGGDERVRGASHPLVVVEPTKAEVLLVAEAHDG